VSGRLGRR